MMYDVGITIDEPLVKRTGRVNLSFLEQVRGITATDAVVEALRKAGFPMPFSISDSTPGMAETVEEWNHRVRVALKECGATRLVVRKRDNGAVELAWD